MTTLKLQNNYSWLNSDNEELKTLLWKALRAKQKGYFFSPLYKQKKWDGNIDFYKRETGRFLTGLLPEIQLALKFKSVPYHIIDERDIISFISDNIDDQFLNQWLQPGRNPVTLHDYQVDYINQVAKTKRCIVRAPTGAGKSWVLVGILKNLPPKTPTLVMTKSTDLTHQLYEDIAAWGFEGLGKCIGSKKKDFCPNIITVANIDSTHKIQSLLPHFRALIVDEVHDMMSKKPRDVYRQMTRASVRVGISATPFKFGETDKCQKLETKGFFGPVVKYQGRILTTKELQERGTLSPTNCVFYPIDEPQLPYETYMDAVTLGIAESIYFNKTVARLAKKLKGRTLIIVERVAQGEMLNQLIPGSHWVFGKDNADSRKEVIELLQKSKNCVCIVQQKLISAGINVFVHNLICCASSKADHLLIQRLGRGLRKANDKEVLNYYDFFFHINEYLTKHSVHRVKILREEGHEVTIKDEIDF